MTIKQRVKLNMYLSVRNIRNKFNDIVQLISKFEPAFANLMKIVDQIQAVSEQQSINKTGLTADKNRLKKKLIGMVLKYSNKLAYLAKSENNETLLREVRIKESDIRSLPGVVLRDRAQVICDRAEANISKLGEQGVTAETISQFQAMITSFNNALSIPRSGIAERSLATRKLMNLYDQADDAISMLDMAVESARDEQPDFYSAYKSARKLVDVNSGKFVLRGVAVDLSSHEPLKGVFFRFRPSELKISGTEEIVKKTAEKGRFNVKSMDPGSYQVVITKTGYKEKDASVTIEEGETSEIVVEMEKE